LPNISASGNINRNQYNTTLNVGEPTETTKSNNFGNSYYELTLTQTIFNAASFAAFSEAKATVRKATAELAAAEQSLIKRAAEKYFGLLLAEVNLELSIAEKTALQKQLELAEARLAAGLAAITEVYEARARYQLAEAVEIEKQNLLEDARLSLTELTGEDIKTVRGLKKNYPLVSPTPADINNWTERALTQNFSVLTKKAELDIAREKISRMRAGHYPSLDLIGRQSTSEADGRAIGSTLNPDSTTRIRRNTIGLQLNIPLVQGGLVMSQTREAAKRFEVAQQLLEQTRRQVKRQTRLAYLNVSSSNRRIRALKQSVISNESVVNAKQEGFKAGLNTNLIVLDAQSDLFLARRDLVNAHYDYILNFFSLKEAAGNLVETDLEKITNWLE
ncbi:MAG: TolC family outer membrane protein, partial [Acidiferrobacterales bacterium]